MHGYTHLDSSGHEALGVAEGKVTPKLGGEEVASSGFGLATRSHSPRDGALPRR